jgi:phosphohistidine swiveling domain-containing protein
VTSKEKIMTMTEAFPVEWQDPADADRNWHHKIQHFPHQITPLEFELYTSNAIRGMRYALDYFELPGARPQVRKINTYVYDAMISEPGSASAHPAEHAVDRANEARHLRRAVDDLGRAWAQDYLPEIRAFLDEFSALELTAQTDAELRVTLDRAVEWMPRLWDLHMLTVFPAYEVLNEFDELYRGLFGDSAALEPYELLGGFGNITVQAGQALWELARRAGQAPEVACRLREKTVAEFLLWLRSDDEQARPFADDLDEFLRTYGQRGDLCSLTAVSWIEDPTPVVRNVATYLDQPERAAPERAVARAAGVREKALARVRAALVGYPRPVVELFEQLLPSAQTGSILTEDHTFYIDYCAIYQMRRVLMEVAARLTARGALDRPEEVFLLQASDLREALGGASADAVRERARSAREEMDRFAGVEPPAMLGVRTPPPAVPAYGPLHRNFSGETGAVEDDASGDGGAVLRGAAGSSGRVRAVARIVRTLAQADRLAAGDVLVAPTTAPPWTPLFAVASAVVTDTGGVLSHCAIVAREYGIPAVVGARGATTTLRDGDLVEVDGDAGTVRVVEES